LFIDLFVRGLIIMIFVSGSVVISYYTTRLMAFLVPFARISEIFLWSGTVVFSAALLMGIAYYYVYHGFGLQSDIVRRKPSAGNKVVLTFDDGPSRDYTPQILKILAEKGVRATFFLVGSHVERYPEVAKQIVDAGHEVGKPYLRPYYGPQFAPAPAGRPNYADQPGYPAECRGLPPVFKTSPGFV